VTILFDYEELQKMFRLEWENHLKEHSMLHKEDKSGLSNEYLTAGFSNTQSDKLSKDKAQGIAKFKAILKVIYQNNQELEKQLKSKGIQF
jgi:hypothetical protein